MIATPWTPLLEGELAVAASSALVELAEGLALQSPEALSPDDCSSCGLFFAYFAKHVESEDYARVSERWLNAALGKASGEPGLNLSLYGGWAGVGWTVEHVTRLFSGENAAAGADEEDPLSDVDLLIGRCLSGAIGRLPYDLISGLAGIGVYYLERLPNPEARLGLVAILNELEHRAEDTWGGRAWRTPPEEIGPTQSEQYPSGYFNLGVAHGAPSVLYLLAEMVVADVERGRALKLLWPATEWLLAQRRPPNANTRFSNWVVAGAEPTDSRLGWCYGDLGIAAVLDHVSRRLSDDQLSRTAGALAARCREWSCQRDDIRDMGLCHGAFGVAHMFGRAFQRAADSNYRTAAVRWYEHGLSMRRYDRGLGGFYSWQPTKQPALVDDRSFLGGSVGCGLALLAAVSNVSPDWDRILLLSGGARGEH